LKFFWRLPPSRPRADDRDPRPLQSEWRGLGVQQSRGWVHYAIHRPEPHIMLYRCERRSPPPSPWKRRRLFALRARARARFPSASRARDRARGGVPARTNPADRSIGGFFIATRRGVETGATRRASTARVPPTARFAHDLTTDLFDPSSTRRRPLNYGQPALTDAGNKANQQ
jgi:cyclin-dependent kinase regulatory subunit CKS1